MHGIGFSQWPARGWTLATSRHDRGSVWLMFALLVSGIHAAQEFTDGYSKTTRDFYECPQGWDPLALLDPAHGHAMQARVIGERFL